MTSGKTSASNKYAVPAVEQMLDIVEHLAQNHRPYGITELARTLGISTNGVFRILRCLAQRGYAEADPAGGYQLGTKFFTLGMQLQARFDLRRRARPHLERLCEQSGETVQLYSLQGSHALVLDCVTPAASSFLQVLPGSRMEIHASAFSKAILAFLPEDEAPAAPAQVVCAYAAHGHGSGRAVCRVGAHPGQRTRLRPGRLHAGHLLHRGAGVRRERRGGGRRRRHGAGERFPS